MKRGMAIVLKRQLALCKVNIKSMSRNDNSFVFFLDSVYILFLVTKITKHFQVYDTSVLTFHGLKTKLHYFSENVCRVIKE